VRYLSIPFCSKFAFALWCAASFSGCAWYGYGDTKKETLAQKLTEQAHRSEARGDLTEATESLHKATQVDPSDVAARWELAHLQRSAGNTPEAIETLRKVVELTPEDSAAWVELGELQFESGDYVWASRSFETALKNDPLLISAMLKQAELEELRGYDEQALELYHRILSIDENHVPAMLNVARIQMRRDQSVRATLLLRSVCFSRTATSDQIAKARTLLGMAYGQQERWEDAVESLKIAAKIERQLTSEQLYYLAYAQYRAEMPFEAKQTTDMILKQDPRYQPAALLQNHLTAEVEPARSQVYPVAFRGQRPPPAPPGWPEPSGKVTLNNL
jgi:tetratricopeptide (TPR) repeat protein